MQLAGRFGDVHLNDIEMASLIFAAADLLALTDSDFLRHSNSLQLQCQNNQHYHLFDSC